MPPEVIDIDALPDEIIAHHIEPVTNNTSQLADDPTDPAPDIHALYQLYNAKHFSNQLTKVYVEFSKRMTLCAGTCTYRGPAGGCRIALSEPLLKLRPASDLRSTLLHEMIHAHLFGKGISRDGPDGHGPLFMEIADKINHVEGLRSGIKVTPYHTFSDEVDHYRTHHWKCQRCKMLIKRSMNRAPGAYDLFWGKHEKQCGGKFDKIKEPPPKEKKRKIGNSIVPKQKRNVAQVVAIGASGMDRKSGGGSGALVGASSSSIEKKKGVVTTFRIDEILAASQAQKSKSSGGEIKKIDNDTNCPVCNIRVSKIALNRHLDQCLAKDFDDDVVQVDVEKSISIEHVLNHNDDDVVTDNDNRVDDDVVLVPSTPTPPNSPTPIPSTAKLIGRRYNDNNNVAGSVITTAGGNHGNHIVIPSSPPLSTQSSASSQQDITEVVISEPSTGHLSKYVKDSPFSLREAKAAKTGKMKTPINENLNLCMDEPSREKSNYVTSSSPTGFRNTSTSNNPKRPRSLGGSNMIEISQLNKFVNLALNPGGVNVEDVKAIISEASLNKELKETEREAETKKKDNNSFQELMRTIQGKESAADDERIVKEKLNISKMPGSDGSEIFSIASLSRLLGFGFDQSMTMKAIVENCEKLPNHEGFIVPEHFVLNLIRQPPPLRNLKVSNSNMHDEPVDIRQQQGRKQQTLPVAIASTSSSRNEASRSSAINITHDGRPFPSTAAPTSKRLKTGSSNRSVGADNRSKSNDSDGFFFHRTTGENYRSGRSGSGGIGVPNNNNNNVTEVRKVKKKPELNIGQCPICDKSVPKNKLQEHVNVCLDNEDIQNEFFTPSQNVGGAHGNSGMNGNELDVPRCPICDKAVSRQQLEAHVDACMTSSGLNDAF